MPNEEENYPHSDWLSIDETPSDLLDEHDSIQPPGKTAIPIDMTTCQKKIPTHHRQSTRE